MSGWIQHLKRAAALMMSAAFFAWLVLPECPCQLHAMFPEERELPTSFGAGFSESHGARLVGDHPSPDSCCCSLATDKALQTTSPEVVVPDLPILAAGAHGVSVAVWRPLRRGGLLASGTDPPGPRQRLHLRVRVFQI